ncbi:MAG: deoxyribonuclease IV, partial [Deltaproteobacteria bacterium]|nr:deoxyribonuclease IV [Deltaproteobacteria bacterium]
ACGQSLPEAVRRIAIALDTIFTAQPAIKAMPLLEMTAGQGSCLGCKWDQMAAILGAVKHPERLGICVDTCHVFAAGYDIRTSQGYQEMLREAQSAVGLSRIKCWHLNDSKADLGSRVDRHEHIGKGKIGLDGFRHVLHDERFRGLPMILETPKDETGRFDRDNLRRLEQLLKK